MTRFSRMRAAAVGSGMFRMGWFFLAAALTAAALLGLYPAQLGVVLAALNKLVIGAWVGYFVDRFAFKYARPHTLVGTATQVAQMRRALIISAAMLAMALGV